MKPKRIILVRHGQSQGNAEPDHYETTPDYALRLTRQGKSEAVEAGKQISALICGESVRAYVSPWYRTRETFTGISSVLGDQIIQEVEDPRIREQDWGHLSSAEKLHNIQNERMAYGPFYFRLPDGESGADVYDRVSTFLETLHRDFAKPKFPDNALIVTHGMTLRIFLMRWFHWSVEYFEKVRNPHNGEVFIMELKTDGRYQLTSTLRLRE
ncbi:Broad specificity phosphatase PhoE [Desulfuromusa kysingii]|uniref:Broad specificity phosphatase PhoE n=1 Tax=Desulfuromusa kysingii TaxID=37625 RepID=A0A1H4DKG7_9BACT|nr:phosphoglycerate mutase family protein [Desulfuromusa kysingii]SEA72930.1 Broad specificity phosphatase PhoE [Desulfuromusa kysingii]